MDKGKMGMGEGKMGMEKGWLCSHLNHKELQPDPTSTYTGVYFPQPITPTRTTSEP